MKSSVFYSEKNVSANIRTLVIVIALLLVTTQYGSANTIYSDGGIHDISTTMPVGMVDISNTTTVNVLSGGNIIGNSGPIGSGVIGYGINCNDSFLNIYSGSSITGGDADMAPAIYADNSIINIYGGAITGGNSISGAGFRVYGSSIANIYGGTLAAGSTSIYHDLEVYSGSVVNIYGSNFNYDLGAISDRSGTITGLLQNGTSLNMTFYQTEPGSIVLIPEPATIALLGIGALSFIRRRNHKKNTDQANPAAFRRSLMKNLIIFASLMLILTGNAQAALIYGVTGSAVDNHARSEVFTFDTSTNTITKLTTTSCGWVYSDIAVTPSGQLYTVGVANSGIWSKSLMQLNPTNGQVTQYWRNNMPVSMNALTAVTDTTLLGVEGGGCERSNLWLIDISGTNPVYTNLGRIDHQSNSGGDIAITPDGYYIVATDNGTDIWQILLNESGDPMPGSATKVCEISRDDVAGLAFDYDSGVLYAGRYTKRNLYTLNLSTGALNSIYTYNPLCWDIFGLASASPIPEPATIALLAFGSLVMLRKK